MTQPCSGTCPRRGNDAARGDSVRPMHWGTAIVIFIHVLVSISLIVLVLAHSGRDSGLGSMAGGSSQGGQHVMERNLDRLTVIVAVVFALTTFTLHRLYN